MAPPSRDAAVLPRETPVSHNIQHGSGRRHLPLGYGGGIDGGRRGRTWRVNTGPGGLLIRQLWTRRVDPTGEAEDVI